MRCMEQANMSGPESITVEVVYALPERQKLVSVAVPPGTTAREALKLSGLGDVFGGLDIDSCPVGVFGREVEPGHVLREGDRVEVYRPLLSDPREQRRTLARRGQGMGRKD